MRIRLANAGDAGGVLAVYAPVVEDTAISFELVVPSVEEMAARITERWPAHPWLVAEDQCGVVGYAYAGRFSGRAAYDWSVEVSVYIAAAARGRHVGRGLYTALFAAPGRPGVPAGDGRGHVAQRGQRGPARVDGLHPGGRVPGGRVEARRLARRRAGGSGR